MSNPPRHEVAINDLIKASRAISEALREAVDQRAAANRAAAEDHEAWRRERDELRAELEHARAARAHDEHDEANAGPIEQEMGRAFYADVLDLESENARLRQELADERITSALTRRVCAEELTRLRAELASSEAFAREGWGSAADQWTALGDLEGLVNEFVNARDVLAGLYRNPKLVYLDVEGASARYDAASSELVAWSVARRGVAPERTYQETGEQAGASEQPAAPEEADEEPAKEPSVQASSPPAGAETRRARKEWTLQALAQFSRRGRRAPSSGTEDLEHTRGPVEKDPSSAVNAAESSPCKPPSPPRGAKGGHGNG